MEPARDFGALGRLSREMARDLPHKTFLNYMGLEYTYPELDCMHLDSWKDTEYAIENIRWHYLNCWKEAVETIDGLPDTNAINRSGRILAESEALYQAAADERFPDTPEPEWWWDEEMSDPRWGQLINIWHRPGEGAIGDHSVSPALRRMQQERAGFP